jgi:tetratricopeptide (TPR) repeat protein
MWSRLWLSLLMWSMPAAGISAAPLDEAIASLARRWDVIEYQMAQRDKAAAFAALAKQAHELSTTQPGHAEPLIWEAIVLCSEAGAERDLGALHLVEEARKLLLQAEDIDPTALDGTIYSNLGSLYYQVPGWPIGFGDKEQAAVYLEKALQLNPDGIEPNYFYGDFLVQQGDYGAAVRVLEKALRAPPRPGREVGDRGRREEVRRALEVARDKAGRS